MTNLQKKIATAVATLGLIANTALPVVAQTTTIVISGNGENTNNDANVAVTNTQTVTQTNTANITNSVNASSDTGNNDADDNTGDVTIATGNASSDVSISNTANTNSAVVDGCCVSDVEVLIEDNVQDSDNTVNLGVTNATTLWQDNVANVRNNVDAYAGTGENSADDNTGTVVISTLDADTTVDISNTLNANSAVVESEGEGGGSVSAWIIGNGENTDNDINLAYTQAMSVVQFNEARLKNDVDADSDTGWNSADDNSGMVAILTGSADTDVTLDNNVNFNFATVDCGECLLSVLAKIGGNVANSDNTINAALTNSKTVFQDNLWTCRPGGQYEGLLGDWLLSGNRGGNCNDVDATADTGHNSADDNAGSEGDPVIITDDADTDVEVTNDGNVNMYGAEDFDLPDFDFNLNLSFNFGDLLDWLMAHGA